MAERFRDYNGPTVVIGETGTGKNTLAEQLHEAYAHAHPRWLNRRSNGRPYVVVDVGAIAPSLFESQMFGVASAAAFTGAVPAPGYLDAAQGGTLVLDHVERLDRVSQAKLLRALEYGYRQLGSRVEKPPPERVIVLATPEFLAQVQDGRFRADLFYRLDGLGIKLPPLRERREDLDTLVPNILGELGERRPLTPQAWEALRAYAWPGNLRELKQTLASARAFATGPAITVADLRLPPAPSTAGLEEPADSRQALGDALEPLRGLTLADATVPLEITEAIVFAGEALAGAPILQAVTADLPAPTLVPYALVISEKEAAGLLAAGVPVTRLIGIVWGPDPAPLRQAYENLRITPKKQVTIAGVTTAEEALEAARWWLDREASAPLPDIRAPVPPRVTLADEVARAFFDGLNAARVITTQQEAFTLFRYMVSNLKPEDGHPLGVDASQQILQTAYAAVLQRYL